MEKFKKGNLIIEESLKNTKIKIYDDYCINKNKKKEKIIFIKM